MRIGIDMELERDERPTIALREAMA